MSSLTVRLLAPEIVLVAVAVAVYLAGAFVDARRAWSWIAGAGIALAAVALWWQGGPATAAAGPVLADALALYVQWLALALGALLVLATARPFTSGTAEYVGSLLLVIAGLMLSAAARELVLLFVALELISIPTYILLYLGRGDTSWRESAAKYFFLSILASAMLLYGLSFLYGTTGSTDLAAIRDALADPAGGPLDFSKLTRLALVLVFAGLSFKIAAVPFHFYAPDVYQGTSHANAALLSVVPKAAGLAVLVRLLLTAMPALATDAWHIALALSVATMTLGNVMALWQDNLRRLLAYSSIAHAGYMLIGLAVGLASANTPSRWDGIGALLFYLSVYALATIGSFAMFAYLGPKREQLDGVDDLAGLGRIRPLMAAVVAVFMFSLAGIPPLAGFWGKFAIFGSALSVDAAAGSEGGLRPWFVGLAIIGVLNAAVAAAYYLRIVAVMYFRTPLGTPQAQGGKGARNAALLCAALVILIGLVPGPLMQQSSDASPGSAVTAVGERPEMMHRSFSRR